MISRHIYIIVTLCTLALVVVGCSTAGGETPLVEEQKQSYESDMELSIEDDQWTYISLSTGEVVGTSDFESAEEDDAWYARNDWDIAFCNGFIRTNSGSSGSAMGGIQLTAEEYDNVESAPKAGYSADSTFGGCK